MKRFLSYAFKSERRIIIDILFFVLMNVFSFFFFNTGNLVKDIPKLSMNYSSLSQTMLMIFFIIIAVYIIFKIYSKIERQTILSIKEIYGRPYKVMLSGDIVFYLISLVLSFILLTAFTLIYKYAFFIRVKLSFIDSLKAVLLSLALFHVPTIFELFRTNIRSIISKFNQLPYLLALIAIFSFVFATKNIVMLVIFLVIVTLLSPYIIEKIYLLITSIKKGSLESSSSYFSSLFVNKKILIIYLLSFLVMTFTIRSYSFELYNFEQLNSYMNYEYVIENINEDKYNDILNVDTITITMLSQEEKGYIGDAPLSIYQTDLSKLTTFTTISLSEGTLNNSENGIVLSVDYKNILGVNVGDEIILELNGKSYALNVSGIVNSKVPFIAYVSKDSHIGLNIYSRVLVKTNYLIDPTTALEDYYNVSVVSKNAYYNSYYASPTLKLLTSTLSLASTIALFVLLLVLINLITRDEEKNNLRIFKKLPVYPNALSRIIYLNRFISFSIALLYYSVVFFLVYVGLKDVIFSTNITVLTSITTPIFLLNIFEIFAFYNIIFLVEYILSNPYQGAY